MSVERKMKTPCTIVQRAPTGEKDRGGNDLTEEVEVETKCALQQQDAAEKEDGGEISATIWNCWLPWGTDLDTGAAVRAKGRTFEVVGEPWDADEGSRSMWHIFATLKRTSGTGGGGS